MYGIFGHGRGYAELRKSLYVFSRGCDLKFKDPAVEKEYCDNIASEVYEQIRILLKVINTLVVCTVLYSVLREYRNRGHLMTPLMFLEQQPAFVFGITIFNIGLWITPKKKSEHAVCGVVFLTLVGFLMFNPIRTRRLGISSDSTTMSSFNELWPIMALTSGSSTQMRNR